MCIFFFFQAEDGIRDVAVTGVQTCALPIWCVESAIMEVVVSAAGSAVVKTKEEPTLEWLALWLTPGLGPTRARRVVEHLGSAAAVFRASLTELEATGILASAAQSLATGKSMELAREEMA